MPYLYLLAQEALFVIATTLEPIFNRTLVSEALIELSLDNPDIISVFSDRLEARGDFNNVETDVS